MKLPTVIGLLALSISCLVSCKDEISAAPNSEITSSATTETVIPSNCAEFQKLVDQTYDFKPTKLNEAQQTAKSHEMDKIWEKVKGDPKSSLPCLLAALKSPNANSFFLFDGGTLLMGIDNSETSKKLVIDSYAKTDLEDITLQNWIAPILRFGLEGLDTSAAGEAWLKANDPGYYLPQHGTLKVNKAVGALAIYGSMDEQFATPALSKIAEQANHPGRDIATDLLITQVTPEAGVVLRRIDKAGLSLAIRNKVDQFINKPTFIESRTGKPKITREQYVKAFEKLAKGDSMAFMELATTVTDVEKDAVVVLQPQDIPLVRKARRFFASTGTPHAPEWYQSFTDILMYLVIKPEIDKQTSK